MIRYPDNYNPILEYWNWILENPEKVNKKIKSQVGKLVKDITDPESDVYFDCLKSNHAIEFAENYCRHIKGRNFAGKLIELDLHQHSFVASIFGICYKKTKLRRTRRAVLIVGKKNGKSILASIIALYMLIADGEGGPECYSVARMVAL